MIVADTSALAAIAFAEPERDAFLQAIISAQRVLVSTVSSWSRAWWFTGAAGKRR